MEQGLEAFLDWIEFTVLSFQFGEEEIVSEMILAMPISDFLPMPKGKMGYKTQLCAPGITILSNGGEGMGIHVIITGKGCRYYEENGSLVSLINRVKRYKHNFTRIDMALDDKSGRIIDMNKISSSVEKGHYLTRWKGYTKVSRYETKDNEKVGETIYFGSRQSLTMMRIYRKGLEAQSEEKDWTRLEIELKGERAQTLVNTVNLKEGIGLAISGILKNYIRFLSPSKDTNKSRWKDSKWWTRIVKDAERLKLTVKPEPKTVEEVKDWLEKQVSTSLAIVALYDMKKYAKFVEKLTVIGRLKMTEKHWKMLPRGYDTDRKFHF